MRNYLRRRDSREEVAKLEREVVAIDRDRAPLALARASRRLAELHADEGKRADAVRWYGRSIDAYLYAGLTGAAAGMCTKLITFEPRVIRARATLAMLLLVSGKNQEAADEIRAFVSATRARGEQTPTTVERLLLLADIAEDPCIRSLIGDKLLELGSREAGEKVLQGIKREQQGEATQRLSEQEKWRKLLQMVT